MKKKTFSIEPVFVQAVLALTLVACNNSQSSPTGADPVPTLEASPRGGLEGAPGGLEGASVPVLPLGGQGASLTYKNDIFLNEAKYSCKGVVISENNIDVNSRINEQIVWLGVEMGQRVRKGQVLVRLDRTTIEDQILKARAELEQAEYRYQAILMGQGYKHDALDQAPESLRKQARSSSGYNTAKAELRQLEHQLSYCTIEAPISGVVTNLNTDQYAMAVAGQPLFRIIDTDHLKVSFEVLENELHRLAVDTAITVIPISYPDDRVNTRINAVSPLIDKNGMVRMEASLPPHPHLMAGMTVVVTLAIDH